MVFFIQTSLTFLNLPTELFTCHTRTIRPSYTIMKLLLTIPTILAAGLIPLASQAATFTSDPVGYSTTTVPDGDDTLIGTPLLQSAALTDNAASITGGVITASADLTGLDFTTTAHFVLITSGANEGQFYTITANDSTTITIDLNGGGDPAVGSYNVIEYWTLDTLLPNGGGIPVSTNVAAASAILLTNNLSQTGTNLSAGTTYLYHDGSQLGTPGWYNAATFAPAGAVVLSPETYFTVRNSSGSSADIVVSGAVPISPLGTQIGRIAAEAQDNQLVNPYPSAITLANSGLNTSGAVETTTNVASPLDTVLIFDNASTGTNVSPSTSYIYHDGSQLGTPGWYNSATFAPADAVEIPAGGAFIVRKATGVAGTVTWTPPVPYTL